MPSFLGLLDFKGEPSPKKEGKKGGIRWATGTLGQGLLPDRQSRKRLGCGEFVDPPLWKIERVQSTR